MPDSNLEKVNSSTVVIRDQHNKADPVHGTSRDDHNFTFMRNPMWGAFLTRIRFPSRTRVLHLRPGRVGRIRPGSEKSLGRVRLGPDRCSLCDGVRTASESAGRCIAWVFAEQVTLRWKG